VTDSLFTQSANATTELLRSYRRAVPAGSFSSSFFVLRGSYYHPLHHQPTGTAIAANHQSTTTNRSKANVMPMKAIQIGCSLLTVSTRGFSTTITTTTTTTTSRNMMIKHRRLIVDTDVGFDDVMAIGALIQNSRDIALITTVHGTNKAAYGAKALESMFPSIPIKAGVEEREGDRSNVSWLPHARKIFADFLRENKVPMNEEALPKTNSAKDAVEQLLRENPEETFDLMCIGPLSNLADWISDESTAALVHTQVNAVWIMGGSLEAGGFNFGQAPEAAEIAVAALSGKIHLVMDEDSGPEIAPPGFTESITAIAKRASKHSWYAKIVQKESKMAYWDPVCVFAFLHQNAVSLEDMAVTLDTKTGLVVEDSESATVLTRVSDVPLEDYKAWIRLLIEKETGPLIPA
jgi:inosine-uridine nucleoside N-ribohydrolase